MSTTSYDLIVVGAGSAGFSGAIAAAEHGASVAFVGGGTIGGTCVNIGCVPSKTLIRAAEALHNSRTANRFNGVTVAPGSVDWQQVMADKTELVARLRTSKYADLLPQYESISYIEGEARVARGGVEVNGDLIKSDRVLITTGAGPALPPIDGIESIPYLTSTDALSVNRLPESLLVIGGGPIGCELGQMFARMGTRVTILCRSRLLPPAEPEISEALQTYLETEGINVVCGVAYKAIRQDADGDGNGIRLDYDCEGRSESLSAQTVLVATGRSPNTEGLGLDELGVELTPRGAIRIDRSMETTVKGIYAAGDVTEQDQYVYMAAYGAKIAASNALNGNALEYDNRAMPRIVFTDPQVASVGLTEREARDADILVETAVISLEHVPRALAARDTRGLIKLVADATTKRIEGAHLIAPEGADAIQTAVMAIKAGFTVDDLAETVFPYLTTVEGMKLAAQTFSKDVGKLSCCAG